MKDTYTTPVLEVIEFQADDIITTSRLEDPVTPLA